MSESFNFSMGVRLEQLVAETRVALGAVVFATMQAE